MGTDNAQMVTVAIELLKFGVAAIQRHRAANNQPLDEPITLDEVKAAHARLRTADDLIQEGLDG